MKSKKKLEEILGIRRTLRQRVLDGYLYRPILFDILSSALLLLINILLKKVDKSFILYSADSLKDLLNELVSTSMSLGGFVLAAMAIIASIKDNTPKLESGEVAETGKDFFYNSSAYRILLRSFSWACLVYTAIFLYFSVVRTMAENIEVSLLFNYTYFGLFVALFTLLRCVYLVQAAVKLR